MIYLLRWFPALAMGFILTGCTHNTVIKCPALIDYTPEFNIALADELDATGRPPRIVTVIGDYISLRDQCRAAAKE